MYVQLLCFVCGFLSSAGTITVCFWNQWAVTNGAESSSMLNSIWGFSGIWVQCMQYTTGQFQCDDFATVMFKLPAHGTATFWTQWMISGPESSTIVGGAWAWRGIWADCFQLFGGQYQCEEQQSMFLSDPYMNAIRAMMCISFCLTVIGCFVLLFGMECSRFLEGNLDMKRRLMRICGITYACAGALTLASVVWYTSMVIYDFFSFTNQDNLLRYELGAAIYLGYISAALCFITTLLCCCLPGPRPEGDKYEDSYPFTRSHKIHFPKDEKQKHKYTEYV